MSSANFGSLLESLKAGAGRPFFHRWFRT